MTEDPEQIPDLGQYQAFIEFAHTIYFLALATTAEIEAGEAVRLGPYLLSPNAKRFGVLTDVR